MVHNFPAIWRTRRPSKALCVLPTLTDAQALSCREATGAGFLSDLVSCKRKVFLPLAAWTLRQHFFREPRCTIEQITSELIYAPVWREQPPASAAGCEQSHDTVPQRPRDTALGWQVAALSHFSYNLLFCSSFK